MKRIAVKCFAALGMLAAVGAAQRAGAEEPGRSTDEASSPAVYQGFGRRDPFVRPGSAPSGDAPSCAARGLQRLRARDLALRGIVKTSEGFLTLLNGPGGESYVARAGDRLCDARVVSIDPDGLVLEEDATPGDAGSRRATARVWLHAR